LLEATAASLFGVPRPLGSCAFHRAVAGRSLNSGKSIAMAYTQNDIDTLKAAIATGARRVKFGSGPDAHEVEYRSLADMQAVLAEMTIEVLGTKPIRTSFVAHCRD
jgi:hypothetical protein